MKGNLTPTKKYEDEVESVKKAISTYGPTPERKRALRKATNRLCTHLSHKKPRDRIAQLECDVKRTNRQNFKLWGALIAMHILIMENARGTIDSGIVSAAERIIHPLTDDAELKQDMMNT